MDSTNWKRAKQVFHEALEKSGPERSGFVATACGEDRDLRLQVEALLNAHDEAGEFLASPTVPEADRAARAATTLTESPPTERAGAMIGHYKLLQVIGEGGFGVVYMAEQEQPVRRRVALKIIKLGMDTKQVIARFEAERQALAMMEHPNIAKVFDAGATETGRPYFVMELVKGVPITEYCDTGRLTTRERLDLFTEVCSAIQHAHQKGIIHRDIKPSNVLVTLHDGKPVPKVIDFGIAKATSQRLTEKTLFTEYGQFIGTPVYMSPEQAEMSGLDIDTRSDIYSLGVLLYELLTGTTPFDIEALRQAGYVEMQRIIREEEPPKPSTRLSTLGGALAEVAKHRKVEPNSLTRFVRGDLDWIVMKALEKNRARRYGSAHEFAGDLGRHLKDEPVQAGPPSMPYRAKKFVRRHKIGVSVAAASLLVLVGFAVTMTVQAGRIAHQRDRANRVAEFLKELFTVSDLDKSRGGIITARELLDKGAKKIDETLIDQPEARAELADAMGVAYRELSLYPQAEPLFEQAIVIRKRVLGDEHPSTLRSMNNLGSLYVQQRRSAEAERIYLETLSASRRVLGKEHPETLRSMTGLAHSYAGQDRYEDAERLHLEILAIRERVLGEEHPETLSSKYALARVYFSQDRLEEAEQLHFETLETKRRALGSDHPQTLISKHALANEYKSQGRYEEAERLYVEIIPAYKRVAGNDHQYTIWSMFSLAGLYSNQQRYEEAEPLYVEALEARNRVHGDDHPDWLNLRNSLANIHAGQGRYEEAEQLYLKNLSTEQPEAARTLYNLGCLEAVRGNRVKALDWLSQAVEAGWDDADYMLEDSDLASFHDDTEFEAIVAEVKKRK